MEKYEATYKCGYPNCDKQPAFTRIIGKSGDSLRSKISDQVKCPKCNNFLRTWDDATNIKKIEEKKD